eukprot:644838-Prymnesium_polylepis.1
MPRGQVLPAWLRHRLLTGGRAHASCAGFGRVAPTWEGASPRCAVAADVVGTSPTSGAPVSTKKKEAKA